MMSTRSRIWILAMVWVGTLFRFRRLFLNDLSSDEALFASWARLIATWQNPLLVGELVDKPPVMFYLQAFFYPLFGPVEWAASMPNFISSIILIPSVGLLAWRLFGNDFISMFSATFVALSTLAIRYSGTAYTDPLLTFFLCLTIVFVSTDTIRNKKSSWLLRIGFLTGLSFGLATATKYQAWLLLPFTVGIGKLRKHKYRFWLSGLGAFLIIQSIVLGWELLHANKITLINRQWKSFGGLRIAWSWELWSRFEQWSMPWLSLFESPIIFIILLFGIPLFLGLVLFRKDSFSSTVQWILVNVLAFFLLHWLLAIPVWERYLLPILPLAAILVASFIYGSINFIQSNLLPEIRNQRMYQFVLFFPLLLLLIQTKSLWQTDQGTYPVTIQNTSNIGVSEVVDYLEDAPYGTVLYDHWYSWNWRYHLFDQKVYVSWFPGTKQLLEDLQVFKSRQARTYIVVPSGVESYPVLRTLRNSGYRLLQVELGIREPKTNTMDLYEIIADQE